MVHQASGYAHTCTRVHMHTGERRLIRQNECRLYYDYFCGFEILQTFSKSGLREGCAHHGMQACGQHVAPWVCADTPRVLGRSHRATRSRRGKRPFSGGVGPADPPAGSPPPPRGAEPACPPGRVPSQCFTDLWEPMFRGCWI